MMNRVYCCVAVLALLTGCGEDEATSPAPDTTEELDGGALLEQGHARHDGARLDHRRPIERLRVDSARHFVNQLRVPQVGLERCDPHIGGACYCTANQCKWTPRSRGRRGKSVPSKTSSRDFTLSWHGSGDFLTATPFTYSSKTSVAQVAENYR